MIGRDLSAYNEIYNHNRMRQFDVALEKYWANQSVYFIIATTVALGTGIADGKLLLCRGISDQSKDKTIATR